MLFVTEHAHWMDILSGIVEFRPLDRLWDPSPQNWRLEFFPDSDRPSRMVHSTAQNRYLLDVRSPTFKGIAKRIFPLERPEYLTITLSIQSHDVSIELPRFRLQFFVSKGELESKNLRGMVIDNDQSTGTMIGLSSQLVLRHKDSIFASLPRSRCVLIPHGSIDFSLSPDKNHVRVHINTSLRRVTWDKYEIDSDVGLLVGSINLSSRLYRIYLHALCSHPLPDPLTGQTGTDHALQELKAAGSFSFQRLTKFDVELLRLIGDLTPPRNYYPQHLRVMQTITWSPRLPALSQHGIFDTAVRKILDYAQSLSTFAGKDTNVDLNYKCESASVLMGRATQRNAVYYEAAGRKSAEFDERYNSRDSPHIADHDSDGTEALNTSRLVYTWPGGLTRDLKPSELLDTFKGWGDMNGPLEGSSLMYTREWLDFNLPAEWLSIYDLCRQAGESASKYQLIFSFAALAYTSSSLREYIPVLLAFATIHQSGLLKPPPHLSYNLTVGFKPSRDQVRSMITSGTNDFDNSPAVHLSRNWNETSEQLHKRQSEYYDNYISSRTATVLENLMIEPHSYYPQSPFHQANDSSWFDTKTIMTTVREYFASCSRNRDLHSFTVDVTTILEANYTPSPLTGQVPRFCFVPQFDICTGQHPDFPFTLENLLSLRLNSAPLYSTYEVGTGAHIDSRPLGEPINTTNLENLISQFRKKSCSKLAQLYSERLETSRKELHGQQAPLLPNQLPPVNDCLAYRDECQSRLHAVFSSIRSALAPSTTTERILADAGLWPRIHHRSVLHPLATTANIRLSPEWTHILTTFAKIFIEYQYSQRLLGYALQSDVEKYFKELDSASFNRQDATQTPDWLLIQARKISVVILSLYS